VFAFRPRHSGSALLTWAHAGGRALRDAGHRHLPTDLQEQHVRRPASSSSGTVTEVAQSLPVVHVFARPRALLRFCQQRSQCVDTRSIIFVPG
jgi:hypothetical protein